ncbi:P22AR C-terminal domain-containing protein [Aeromonas sp. 2MA4]|uniref:P22AR C-terminal domain-containing protein n=1 Tax=Aeromonas sp. 2MA4 TaxID=2699195 RepID=UPI0023DDF335|nr:P22AR C-terminal domain-containing protein [Aeromonas sp. 2MA4]
MTESEGSQEGSHKPHLHPQCGRVYPLFEVAKHREADTYYSIIHEYPMTLAAAQRILADKTRHVQSAPHDDRD